MPFESICLKEITVSGSIAHTMNAWRRAIDLCARGRINPRDPISHRLPLSDWKRGFDIVQNKEGPKVILFPD